MGPVGAIWLSEILTAHLAAEPHPTAQTFLAYVLSLTPAWATTAAKHNVDTIIFWDVTCEKATYKDGRPHSPFNHLWYLGDVCGLDPLFPAASVTTVAKDLRHKGVKSIGSCVRPGDIVEAVGNRPKREDPEDWGFNLVDKMQRAKAIGIGDAFYVDTNILSITRGPIPANLLMVIRNPEYFPTELIAFEITGPSTIGNPPSAIQDYYDHFYGYKVVTVGNPPPVQIPGCYRASPYLIHPCDVTGPALDAMLPDFIAAVKAGARMVVRVQWDGDPYWTFVDKVYQ